MKNRKLLVLALGGGLFASTLTTPAMEPEPGFTSLFNGKDLSGWTGNPKFWSVRDGVIVGQTTAENPTKGNTFLIWTAGTTADFELRLSYRIIPNNEKGFANSGIQYRSKVLEPENWVVGGYQADFEAGKSYSGILYEERMTRGIMAARGEKVLWDKDCKKQVTGSVGKSDEIQAAIKPEAWNDYVIIAQGNRLRHFINGRETVDVTDECDSKRALDGVLALQLHAGLPMTVQFRDIRIKPLASGADAADALRPLQGVWRVAGGEADGTPIPPEDVNHIIVTIEGAAYTVQNNERTDRGNLTVDASKTPGHMEIRPKTGDDAGRALPAIFKADGDTLSICYNLEGAKRPETFAAEKDSGFLLLNLKRTSR